jgi:hypothetical protein
MMSRRRQAVGDLLHIWWLHGGSSPCIPDAPFSLLSKSWAEATLQPWIPKSEIEAEAAGEVGMLNMAKNFATLQDHD